MQKSQRSDPADACAGNFLFIRGGTSGIGRAPAEKFELRGSQMTNQCLKLAVKALRSGFRLRSRYDADR